MKNFIPSLSITAELIWVAALLVFAGASLLIGTALLRRGRSLNKQSQRLDAAVAARSGVAQKERDVKHAHGRIVRFGLRGVASSLGKSLVADEDRVLLDQCGVDSPAGRAWFFLARAILGFGLPVLGWVVFGGGSLARVSIIVFFGFGLGYLGPKWFMSRRATARRKQADAELPLLVDLLRLLQGVGLSVDQTMQLIEQDFQPTMPVLVTELGHAAAQYRSGQTRESSMQRFAKLYRNDDMASIADLIVQVDKFGGAVQEPLRIFGERMRDRRRNDMKAKVGQLTVKMTGVMVVTLLPALIIVTGGAGFIAIFRGLAHIQGG